MEYGLLFFGGLLAFLSPCHLSLLPVFVSFFAAGTSTGGKALGNALSFVLGFTVVFVVLGAFASTLGQLVHSYLPIINILSGCIVIALGLDCLGILNFHFLHHEKSDGMTGRKLGLFSSFFFGLVFSISWIPCAGAFLLSALSIASADGFALHGVCLLLAFSAGLGLPYVLSVLLIDRLKTTFASVQHRLPIISRISGLVMILLGIFIASGLMEHWTESFHTHGH